jgi:PTH1 family peptidyl-tRNA hydrolase
MGIGSGFRKGSQTNYVLGKWSPEEKKFIDERIAVVIEMIKSFGTVGTELTMTAFNKLAKVSPRNEEATGQGKI